MGYTQNRLVIEKQGGETLTIEMPYGSVPYCVFELGSHASPTLLEVFYFDLPRIGQVRIDIAINETDECCQRCIETDDTSYSLQKLQYRYRFPTHESNHTSIECPECRAQEPMSNLQEEPWDIENWEDEEDRSKVVNEITEDSGASQKIVRFIGYDMPQ